MKPTFFDAIPWIISLGMFWLALLTYARNSSKDRQRSTKEEEMRLGSIKENLLKANLKLDQVCSTTVDIKTETKAINDDVKGLNNRIVAMDKDLKTAFQRIEKLERKVEKNV